MKHRSNDREMAINMRREGLTYKEIGNKLNVSKGLLSLWFKGIPFTNEELEKLVIHRKERKDRGKVASLISNRGRRIERELMAGRVSREKFDILKHDPLFLPGLLSILGNASITDYSFYFHHDDPELVLFVYTWLQKYLNIKKKLITIKLFTDKVGEGRDLLFLSTLLDVDSAFIKICGRNTRISKKKTFGFNSSVRIGFTNVSAIRALKTWQKSFIEYYKKVSLPLLS